MSRAAGLVSGLLCCLAGCRRDPPEQAATAAAAEAAGASNLAVQLAWLPRDTMSVGRLRRGSIFVLDSLASQLDGPKPDCWQRIEKTIDAGYIFETTPGRSLLGFQTGSERSEIERCIEAAFPDGDVLHAPLQREGDTTIVETAIGRMLLWWQGHGWVLAGAPDEIRQVRAARELGPDACVTRVLAAMPDRPIAYSSCNPMFDSLLGVRTRGWVLGATADEREGIRAEVTVFYPSADDAARARGALAPDRLPDILAESLRDRVGRLPSAVEGDRLVIRVEVSKADFDSLDLVSLALLSEDMKVDSRSTGGLEDYIQQQEAVQKRHEAKGPPPGPPPVIAPPGR
jgi:hypothetical protein